jgi:hypothetical protein
MDEAMVIAQLAEISALAEDGDSYGVLSPSSQAISGALLLLSECLSWELPPILVSTNRGGIIFEWSDDDQEINF